MGNPGDVKPAGHGISEMRIDYGAGYRVYFLQRDPHATVLLCAGDKRTQDADIKRALTIAADWAAPPPASSTPTAAGPKKDRKKRERRARTKRTKE